MTSAAATNLRKRPAALALLLTAACAGAPEEVYTPGDLTKEQRAECRAVAQAYVDNDEGYPEMREQLRRDPVAAAWFVRYLEQEIVAVREGQAVVVSEERVRLDQIRAQRKERVEWNVPGQRPDSRAIGQIVAMGPAAVEVVMNDLVRSPQEFLRTIGIEILTGIGDPAVAPLLEMARTGDPKEQRIAARALGAVGADGAALAALRELSTSTEWTVRGGVAEALSTGGGDARALLLEMLGDEDPFVRRKAAESLGQFADAAAASALVDFLESCQTSNDWTGELAAQKALQVMASAKGPRTAEAWRRFAATLPPAAEGR